MTLTTKAAPTERRVLELEAQLAAVTVERDNLRLAYQNLQHELELMRRRIFVAKAERLDTAQLELEFAHKLAALDALGRVPELPAAQAEDVTPDGDGAGSGPLRRNERHARTKAGRRNLRLSDLPEERIELSASSFDGDAEPIGWEESCRMAWRRGGFVRLVVARAKYRDPGSAAAEPTAEPTIITTPLPPEILPRSLATPSLLAHVLTDKFCDGLPFHRQQDRAARTGTPLDRSTMSRWAEEVGSTAFATVIEAMRKEALRTAFCISTDATGVLVQPPDHLWRRRPAAPQLPPRSLPGADSRRRSCLLRVHAARDLGGHRRAVPRL